MKINTIKKRLAKARPMISVTLRMPEDVVKDLKRIAPLKGFSGYQALLRAYVGTGLRDDMERIEGSEVAQIAEKRFSSVWDAIEDTPEEAENMKLRSALMMDIKHGIHGEAEYRKAIEPINKVLDVIGDDEDHPLSSLLSKFADLVIEYEKEHYPIDDQEREGN